jgi:hypothetical protein
MASYCLVNLVCRDYQLCFTLVFWLFVFCLSLCYLKLRSNHVAISNTEFTSWFGLRLPLVICWIL